MMTFSHYFGQNAIIVDGLAVVRVLLWMKLDVELARNEPAR